MKKHRKGTLSEQERMELDQLYLRHAKSSTPLRDGAVYARRMKEMDNAFPFYRKPSTRRISRWLPYAAAVILVALAGTWIFFGDRIVNRTPQIVNAQDIDPGSHRATLTLADGRTIDLSQDQYGIVIGDETITYQDGSSLAGIHFGPTPDGDAPPMQYVLTTPQGGTYQITLSDGTDVWLNAGSTLKYPSHFTGTERTVEIIGEAYFDVAKDQKMPFQVNSPKQQIEVVGTEFNVQAYEGDAETKTTLVAGSVRVVATGTTLQLVPGEQSIWRSNGITKSPVDTEAATAWKNGYFKFDGDLKSIMAQISRWYDIDVVFDKNVDTSMELMGRISRDKKLSDILLMLQDVDEDLKFKIEDLSANRRDVSAQQRERRLSVMR